MSLGLFSGLPLGDRLCADNLNLDNHPPSDQYSSGTYLATATSEAFKAHSVLATVNTIRSVFQA
jgi:hypothetical protein